MKRKTAIFLAAFWPVLAASVFAQSARLQMDLDHLAKKAVSSVIITLDKNLLGIAGNFLDSKKADEARVKNVVSGLEGIYVRSFQFEKEGAYSPADVETLRKQLADPAWTRILETRNARTGENVDIYLRREGGKILGLALIASEPKELTVVNITGSIDLEKLRDLEGHLGVPRIEIEKKSEKPGKPKDDE